MPNAAQVRYPAPRGGISIVPDSIVGWTDQPRSPGHNISDINHAPQLADGYLTSDHDYYKLY